MTCWHGNMKDSCLTNVKYQTFPSPECEFILKYFYRHLIKRNVTTDSWASAKLSTAFRTWQTLHEASNYHPMLNVCQKRHLLPRNRSQMLLQEKPMKVMSMGWVFPTFFFSLFALGGNNWRYFPYFFFSLHTTKDGNPPIFKNELVLDRGGTLVLRPSMDQLKREAAELETQIRQLQVNFFVLVTNIDGAVDSL